jgi:NTP pyrophosphatase (non-canonical NTP hydrolase)
VSALETFAAWHAEVARCGKHYDPNADIVVKDALGLAGEVGEVVDLIKKDRFQAQPFDRDKLRNEMGDVLWYLTNLATSVGMTLQEVAEANAAKLRKRYPDGFVPGGGVR